MFKYAFLLLGMLWGCTTAVQQDLAYHRIEGRTMGTTYNITYATPTPLNWKNNIDSLLVDINNSVSNYIDSSFVSRVNRNEIEVISSDTHFLTNLMTSLEVHRHSEGYFDPTVMPLVNYWGFGYEKKVAVTYVDSIEVTRRRNYVGMDKIVFDTLNGEIYIRKDTAVNIDFGGIAKGYGVDQICQFLEKKGCANYMVEIGGEVRAKGKNTSGQAWRIGISTPKPEALPTDFQNVINLDNIAMASSGNYRNYYTVGEKMYGHEINPFTGYPEMNELLGVSVLAPSCILADGYATAFMVMGMERSKALMEKISGIDVALYYSDNEGNIQAYMTPGFKASLLR